MGLQLLLAQQLPDRLGMALRDTALLDDVIDPTGTITFELYGPDDDACGNAPIFTSVVTVDGIGTYTSEPFVPTSPGVYRWIASYSGDVINPPISHTCNA